MIRYMRGIQSPVSMFLSNMVIVLTDSVFASDHTNYHNIFFLRLSMPGGNHTRYFRAGSSRKISGQNSPVPAVARELTGSLCGGVAVGPVNIG